MSERHVGGIALAPVHDLCVCEPMATPIKIGNRVFLEHLDRLPRGENWRKYFGLADSQHLEDASLALTAVFAAKNGQFTLAATQDAERAILHALLALWIYHPTAARITHFFHFGQANLRLVPSAYNRQYQTFFCDRGADTIAPAEVSESELSTICNGIGDAFSNHQPIRIALWHLFEARRQRLWQIRFVSLCVVLESLFSSSSQEITHKLAERVGVFLHGAGDSAYEQYKIVKNFYTIRSKIVHGQDLKLKIDDGGRKLMESLEETVRLALRKVLRDRDLVTKFNSKKKEEFLTKLVLGAD